METERDCQDQPSFRAIGLVVGMALLSCLGCAGAGAPAAAGPDYKPTATLREVMHAIVAPSAAVIWDSVVTSSTAAGVEHKEPTTDEEWESIENGVLTLLEASNLLLMPGRPVAHPGETADAPGIELEPSRVGALIAQKPDQWASFVRSFREASADLLDASRAKDVQRLFDGGAELYNTCEGCHRTFWFPDAIPVQ